MFEARHTSVGVLKKVIDAIKDIRNDAIITCSESGIEVNDIISSC